MKIKMILGSLLLTMTLMFAPVVTARAKEVKLDGNIPLTAEYFPDEWFLKAAAWYDKNKDDSLSSEEIAAVDRMWITGKITDFSQVQYFTNLRELEVSRIDETIDDGVWIGTDIDLTVFPNLETVRLELDARQASDSSSMCEIRASGLKYLKSIRIYVKSAAPSKYDGATARIRTVDLTDTPALEVVGLSRVQGVKFDDVTKIKELSLSDIKEIPFDQIGGFTELEDYFVLGNLPEFRCMDVSKNKSLKTLWLINDYLEEVKLAGADGLEEILIESDALSHTNVSQNPKIKFLRLDCPKLERLDVSQNKELQSLLLGECFGLANLSLDGAVSLDNLRVGSDHLTALNLGSNKALTRLDVKGNKIAELDVTKNTKLIDLSVESKAIKKLNLKKNTKLTRLGIDCKQLSSLDLSKNKNLTRLFITSSLMKSVDLSSQKNLDYLGIRLKKLKSLDALKLPSKETLTSMHISDSAWKTIDLSKFPKLREVYLENNKALTRVELSKNIRLKELEIHGSPKLAKLDLRKNKRLFDVNVSGNGLKAIYLGASKPDLTYFDCRDNKLTSIDLSGVSKSYHTTIYCDKKVKVKGYKGKVYH